MRGLPVEQRVVYLSYILHLSYVWFFMRDNNANIWEQIYKLNHSVCNIGLETHKRCKD